MKKLLLLFLVFLFIIPSVLAGSKLKDYNTLVIYIKNQEYKGKKFLHEDGMIYVSAGDLRKVLKFEYKYDREKKLLYVNNAPYEYAYILKGQEVYVPLTTFCTFLGYYPTYTEWSNTLDISTREVKEPDSVPSVPAKTVDGATYILYIPSDLDSSKKYPLVIALSPDANAAGLIDFWKDIGETYKMMIIASKEYRNGQDMEPPIKSMANTVKSFFGTYPIDEKRIIATGMSGGGMVSHAFSFLYPDLIRGIIVNTGMMHEEFAKEQASYPGGKIAVFLASPTDFRYNEMKRDRAFLEGLGWKTNWIEFEGGHVVAPVSVYHQAVRWIKDQM